jgi:hypothetical protein
MIVNRIGKIFLAQPYTPIPEFSGYLPVLTLFNA